MTDKRPATNQEILDALTKQAKINEGYVSVVLDNNTFHIHISCGEFIGAPRRVLKNLADYELVSVELWYHKDDPEDAKSVTTKTFTMPKFDVTKNADGWEEYTINTTFFVFPHQLILVNTDPQFKDQPWAYKFHGHNADVSPDVLCDILRYCHKLSNLKSFW